MRACTAAAFASLLVAMASSSAAPTEEPAPQAITLFASGDDITPQDVAEQSRALSALRSGKFGAAEDYVTRARLAFKMQPRVMAAATLELPVGAPAASAAGWRSTGDIYSWRGDRGAAGAGLELPLASVRFQPASQDEVWIDYRTLPRMPACQPQLIVDLTKKGVDGTEQRVHAYSGVATALKPYWSDDVLAAAWEKKGAEYVIRRVFGLAADARWRYAQERDLAVLQRRMDVPLSGVQAIGISILPGAHIEQVNVRVADKGVGGRVAVLKFPTMAATAGARAERSVVRLDLRAALEQAGLSGAHRLVMQELIVFVPGEARAVVGAGILRHVALLGVDPGSVAAPGVTQVALDSRDVQVGDRRTRVVADLRVFGRAESWQVRSIAIRLVPPDDAEACAVVLTGVHAVSAFTGSAPSYAVRMEEWSRRAGGPFALQVASRGLAENPGFVAYLPFSSLTVTGERGNESVEEADNEVRTQGMRASPTAAPMHATTQKRRRAAAAKAEILVSSSGATLAAVGPPARIALAGANLVLEGSSEALDLMWPVHARIRKHVYVRLGVVEGADDVASIGLSIELADGRVLAMRMAPNQPVKVDSGPAEIRMVRARIIPSEMPFKVKLSDLSILEPAPATFADALRVALPSHEVLKPKPLPNGEIDSLLDASDGAIRGLFTPAPSSFSTILEPALDAPEGLRLEYHLPARYLGEERCALTLEMEWEHGRTARQVCFDKPEGVLFLTFAELIGGASTIQPLGALRAVHWCLHPYRSATVHSSFALDYAFQGWTMMSAADRLRTSALLRVGSRRLFARPEEIDRLSADRLPKVWLTLPDELMREVMRGRDFEPADQALFTVDRVVAQPRKALSVDQWRAITTPPAPPAPARWLKWAALLAVIFGSWLVWRRRVSWPAALRRNTARIGTALCEECRRPAVAQILHSIYIGIGISALVVVAWLGGHAGFTFGAAAAFIAIVLVGSTMELQLRSTATDERRRRRIPRLAVAGVAASIVAALWAAGRSGITPELAWAALPLAASLYVALPVLPWLTRHAATNHPRGLALGGWAGVALLLYAGGAIVGESGSENDLYTLGGLGAVFATRAFLRVLEPAARVSWPRIAESVYDTTGGTYFCVALLALAATAAALATPRGAVAAEQLGVIVYFGLALGVLKGLWSRRVAAEPRQGRQRRATDVNGERRR